MKRQQQQHTYLAKYRDTVHIAHQSTEKTATERNENLFERNVFRRALICHLRSDRGSCLHSSSIDLLFCPFFITGLFVVSSIIDLHRPFLSLSTPHPRAHTHALKRQNNAPHYCLACSSSSSFSLPALLLSICFLYHTHKIKAPPSLRMHPPPRPFSPSAFPSSTHPFPPSSRYLVATIPLCLRARAHPGPPAAAGSEQTHITHTRLAQSLVPKAHVSTNNKKCGNSVDAPEEEPLQFTG